ncbi:restriction endonuclease subunit S [Hydrogenophaga sp. NFH-34]|uniref:restriction endonuclease subunit S n=1 Tax=Hydrogenophaga sp. NFH-34 TaxID=2744446 RepID=UPI001F45E13C|nr:restriction endonuclease subunit S [Hydrogenophaga sp. NFH-34]
MVRLSDVAQINPRFDKTSLADDAQVSFVPMAAVGAADGQIDASTTRPFGEVKKGYTPFREGDVLFAKVTPCMENGKMAVARGLQNGVGFGSSEFHVLRPSERVDAKYLYHFVSSESFRKEAARHMTGAVGLRRVPTAFLADAELPLVDLDEQRRIVAEIDKQFSRLDEAVANLQRVKANLKRYKATVLKAAVEGRLVETEASLARREGRGYETGDQLLQRILDARMLQWQKKGAYITPTGPQPGDRKELPEGWAWATVEQLNPGNRPCAYGVLQPGDDLLEGIPFVRVGDINDGVVNSIEMKRIHPEIAGAYPRTKLSGGEVLLTLVGAIGRTAVVPANLAGGNVARAVGVLPINDLVDPHWVEVWFRNPAKILEMTEKSHEVARKTLNLEDVRLAAVAVPPKAEQARIFAEVDRRLSVIREVEAEVNANLLRAQALRQSVLQSAFSESDRFDASNSVVARTARAQEAASVVIAARVIAQNCEAATFGRVKLQKLLFLSTHYARVEASNDEYARLRAGPADLERLQGVLKRLDQLRWFRERSRERGNRPEGAGYTYERLTLADDYKNHLSAITGDQLNAVDYVCQSLRTWSTDDCELLATVYAAWNDLLLLRRPISDEALVEELHEHWHESKRRFTVQEISAMRRRIVELRLEPTGFGKPTRGTAADVLTKDFFDE